MKLPVEKLSSRPVPYSRRSSPRRSASDLPPTVNSGIRARRTARQRPQLRPLDFSSVRKGATAEVSAFTSTLSDAGLCSSGCETPVALRRASTVTLPSDDSVDEPVKRSQASKYDSVTATYGSRSSSIKTLSSGSTDRSVCLSRTPSCDELSKDKSGSARNSFSNVSSLLRSLTIPKRLSSCRTDSTRSIPAEHAEENNLAEAIDELQRMTSRSMSRTSSKSTVSLTSSGKSNISSSRKRSTSVDVSDENNIDISEKSSTEVVEKTGERKPSFDLSKPKRDASVDRLRSIDPNTKLSDDAIMVDNDDEQPLKAVTAKSDVDPVRVRKAPSRYTQYTESRNTSKGKKRDAGKARQPTSGNTRVVPKGVNKASVLAWKKRKEAVAILKRENIPDSYMNKTSIDTSKPDSFKWTRWTLALSPEQPKSKTKFVKCTNYPGYRLKTIFGKDSQKPALYEFAAQCPGTSKKHVVYHRSSAVGYKTVVMWDLYQFRHKSIQAEISRALESGCTIWMRRGTLRDMCSRDEEERRVRRAEVYVKTMIDYAWKKYLWRKEGDKVFHREVVVKRTGSAPIVISHGNL